MLIYFRQRCFTIVETQRFSCPGLDGITRLDSDTFYLSCVVRGLWVNIYQPVCSNTGFLIEEETRGREDTMLRK